MRRIPIARLAAVLVVLSIVIAACGQKSGVHQAGGLVGEGGVNPGTGPGATTGPGGIPGVTGPGGPGQPGTVTGPGGGGPAAGPGGVVGGNRTGITDKTITIGIHAPTTGAAPVQGKAFEAGARLYWNWLHKTRKQKVFGREVKVVFRNDEYTPTTAVAVCNEMATSEKAFLLIGGAGTDQINACAGYADQQGIPYFSPGVQEAGLVGRRTYFAVTMSYKQQMPLLAQLLKKEHQERSLERYGPGEIKVGFVRPNTPNFNDSDEALRQAITAAGFTYKKYSVSKEARSDEAGTVAAQLKQDNVDVVVPITAPVFTIQLVTAGGSAEYKPQYAGVAISNNINQAINRFCNPGKNEYEGAISFSPWPGWKNVMSGEYDKDFADAAQQYASAYNTRTNGGDILLALWGIMKTIHRMFQAAGANMSRESFVQTVSTLSVGLKVFPDLRYSPTNHLGAQNVHVLKGSCTEPAGPGVQPGPQWITHPRYEGLRGSF